MFALPGFQLAVPGTNNCFVSAMDVYLHPRDLTGPHPIQGGG